MTEISDRYGPLPGDVILLGELMGSRHSPAASVLALEVSSTPGRDRAPGRLAGPSSGPGGRLARLPDGQLATQPPARDKPCWESTLVLPNQGNRAKVQADSSMRGAADCDWLPQEDR